MEEQPKIKKFERTTPEQIAHYLQFCEEHPDLLARKKNSLSSPNAVRYLWEQLAAELNAKRGPTRTWIKWKETLGMWKSQLRSRARKRKADQQMEAGDGSPSANDVLGIAAIKDFEKNDEKGIIISEIFSSGPVLRNDPIGIVEDSREPVYHHQPIDIVWDNQSKDACSNKYDWLGKQVIFELNKIKSQEIQEDAAWAIQVILRDHVKKDREIRRSSARTTPSGGMPDS